MQNKSVAVSDGTKLHYIEAGDGRPLVIIPGWPQSAAEFRNQTEAFATARRVIALDMRGHGESQKLAKGYRIQRLAKDLFDVIAALDLETPDVLGHSMGRSVIWSYLSMFGAERPLGRLVLVDQAPCVIGQPGWDDETVANSGCLFLDMEALVGFEGAVVASDAVAAHNELIRGMFTTGVAQADLDWIAEENLKLPRAEAAHLLHDHSVLDWRTEIQAITNPTLVIGAEASIFSAASQRWIAAQIPGVELEIFEAHDGGSHFMFFENPARFNARVMAFLN